MIAKPVRTRAWTCANHLLIIRKCSKKNTDFDPEAHGALLPSILELDPIPALLCIIGNDLPIEAIELL